MIKTERTGADHINNDVALPKLAQKVRQFLFPVAVSSLRLPDCPTFHTPAESSSWSERSFFSHPAEVAIVPIDVRSVAVARQTLKR
jgi:hypothetical protein